jgi:hypothetical protein
MWIVSLKIVTSMIISHHPYKCQVKPHAIDK